jgi:hypothetical protein
LPFNILNWISIIARNVSLFILLLLFGFKLALIDDNRLDEDLVFTAFLDLAILIHLNASGILFLGFTIDFNKGLWCLQMFRSRLGRVLLSIDYGIMAFFRLAKLIHDALMFLLGDL